MVILQKQCLNVSILNIQILGLQKFRTDFDGLRTLRLNESSHFKFKISRYAELLMDTYLVVSLPHIWSPILPPNGDDRNQWRPYEFKWIKNLGSQMIKEVKFTIGGQIIQQFSGSYLQNLVERDFNESKKQQYYNMTGNVSELNDPANSGTRVNVYPNAYYDGNSLGSEPSIRARKLYIPLNVWFTLAAKMAFPLVSLQYNELNIEIEMRPINELYVIRDVTTIDMNYIQANQTIDQFQFYRFLQQPPNTQLDYTSADKRSNWAADVHLISTYAFLSEDEMQVFAANHQQYLIKEVYEYSFPNVTGTKKVKLDSLSMVANWMWHFQRSDAYLRNEWSNYSNWPYNYLPSDLKLPSQQNGFDSIVLNGQEYTPSTDPIGIGCYDNMNNTPSNIYVTGRYNVGNQKDIMQTWALLLDGKYRENEFDAGVFNYVEKYSRSSGNSPDGLYCYNFNLKTDPFDFQPSGAMNLSKFKNIQFEFNTFQPPLDPSAQVFTVCDQTTGDIIGINKPTWRIYDYNYDLTVFEERFNILTFTAGNAALMYAR